MTMFIEGVLHQLEVFAQSSNVGKDDVFVKMTFSDGESITLLGLRLIPPFGTSDWGMIRGRDSDSQTAMVVREEDLRRVEFQLAPKAPRVIGFGN